MCDAAPPPAIAEPAAPLVTVLLMDPPIKFGIPAAVGSTRSPRVPCTQIAIAKFELASVPIWVSDVVVLSPTPPVATSQLELTDACCTCSIAPPLSSTGTEPSSTGAGHWSALPPHAGTPPQKPTNAIFFAMFRADACFMVCLRMRAYEHGRAPACSVFVLPRRATPGLPAQGSEIVNLAGSCAKRAVSNGSSDARVVIASGGAESSAMRLQGSALAVPERLFHCASACNPNAP